jgi:hypothetical protein
MMRASRARRWRVQLRLELVEAPAPPVAVWDGLTLEQRAEVVALLARLMVNTLTGEEADDG